MAPDTVRTIPPWVVRRPPHTVVPRHNHTPATLPGPDLGLDDNPDADLRKTNSETQHHYLPQLFKRRGGRKWDHLRSAEPVIIPRHRTTPSADSQWRDFIASSRYPHLPNEESQIVDEEVMAKLQPTFGYPVQRPRVAYSGSEPRKPKPLYQRAWMFFLRHPFSPLVCRVTVLSTSILALSLAARIFHRENLYGSPRPERTQIIVAIVVDVVAIPYIGYLAVDDYTGKPLGLRPPKSRITLIMMDLFFIIFKAASTALGFEAMLFFAKMSVLSYLRALVAFELIGLLSWAMTLTINVFREIERLGG